MSSPPPFSPAIAEHYERWMVPLLFAPYAADLVARAAARPAARVLEIAAGTGVVTRGLADALPSSTAIVATDLHEAMIDRAAAAGTSRPVEWRVADALALPFEDGSFDLVVCQFGVMFFPDRARAFGEMHRVLQPGGRALVSTWDKLADNELALAVNTAVAELCPGDPPDFFDRVPHGYFDAGAIRADLAAGGLAAPSIATLTLRSRAASPEIPARALCAGTPLRAELEARGVPLEAALAAATARIAVVHGPGAIDAKMQALVVEIERGPR